MFFGTFSPSALSKFRVALLSLAVHIGDFIDKRTREIGIVGRMSLPFGDFGR